VHYPADTTLVMKTISASQLSSGGMSWSQTKEIVWCRTLQTTWRMLLTLSRFV